MIPSSCARCSTWSRSGPSPTMQRHASTPRSRSCLNASSTSPVRLTPVMRPIQPTVKRSGAIPSTRRVSSRPLRAAQSLLELDPEPHDGELLARRDSEPDEVVAHLGADRDERVGSAGEPALEQPEAERAQRAEVPAQHVAVEGVHDDRRTRVTREERRHAPDRPGLRRVRVQDRRPLAPDQLREPEHRERRRGSARCRGGAPAAARPSRRAHQRRTPSSPRRARDCRRRASCRSRARGARRRGRRRAARARPCSGGRSRGEPSCAPQARARNASAVRRSPSSSPTCGSQPSSRRASATSAHESRTSPVRGGRYSFSTRLAEHLADCVGERVDAPRLAGGDVHHVARSLGRVGCPDVRVDDVVDVGEVAGLLAVAVDRHGLACVDRGDEARHDRGVLRSRVLARTEDVEVAERDRLEPVDARERDGVALRGELRDRVGRERVRELASRSAAASRCCRRRTTTKR